MAQVQSENQVDIDPALARIEGVNTRGRIVEVTPLGAFVVEVTDIQGRTQRISMQPSDVRLISASANAQTEISYGLNQNPTPYVFDAPGYPTIIGYEDPNTQKSVLFKTPMSQTDFERKYGNQATPIKPSSNGVTITPITATFSMGNDLPSGFTLADRATTAGIAYGKEQATTTFSRETVKEKFPGFLQPAVSVPFGLMNSFLTAPYVATGLLTGDIKPMDIPTGMYQSAKSDPYLFVFENIGAAAGAKLVSPMMPKVDFGITGKITSAASKANPLKKSSGDFGTFYEPSEPVRLNINKDFMVETFVQKAKQGTSTNEFTMESAQAKYNIFTPSGRQVTSGKIEALSKGSVLDEGVSMNMGVGTFNLGKQKFAAAFTGKSIEKSPIASLDYMRGESFKINGMPLSDKGKMAFFWDDTPKQANIVKSSESIGAFKSSKIADIEFTDVGMSKQSFMSKGFTAGRPVKGGKVSMAGMTGVGEFDRMMFADFKDIGSFGTKTKVRTVTTSPRMNAQVAMIGELAKQEFMKSADMSESIIKIPNAWGSRLDYVPKVKMHQTNFPMSGFVVAGRYDKRYGSGSGSRSGFLGVGFSIRQAARSQQIPGSGLKGIQMTRARGKPRIDISLMVGVIQVSGTKSKNKQLLNLGEATAQRQKQKQSTSFSTFSSSSFRRSPPFRLLGFKGSPFFSPKGKGIKNERFDLGFSFKVSNRKYSYGPQFAAVELGITATKRPKTFTGLEFQPMISTKRRKKR